MQSSVLLLIHRDSAMSTISIFLVSWEMKAGSGWINKGIFALLYWIRMTQRGRILKIPTVRENYISFESVLSKNVCFNNKSTDNLILNYCNCCSFTNFQVDIQSLIPSLLILVTHSEAKPAGSRSVLRHTRADL